MLYVLIGETQVDDGPLYVLWTRDASGVRVLPIGSAERRDVAVVGRRLMEDWAPDGGQDLAHATHAAATGRDDAGRPLRLVELADHEREAIARAISSTIELTDSERPDGLTA